MKNRPKGLIAAAATPLTPDRAIDIPRLAAHCRGLLERGCDGINLLGTTGEATSFSVDERLSAMRAVAESGLPLERFLVGTGAANQPDAVALTRAAMAFGYGGALLLPPFYYKQVDPDGAARYVDEVIARVEAPDLRLYLYHYPQLSGVPFDVETVAQLRARHPRHLLGVKDSSGELAYSTRLAAEVPDLDVFPSSEGTIGIAKARGFAGCISATLNVNAELSAAAWANPTSDTGQASLARAVSIREALAAHKLVASVKHALSLHYRDTAWRALRSPLTELDEARRIVLEDRLGAI